jgi:DNA-directed RNA polymerase subunit H
MATQNTSSLISKIYTSRRVILDLMKRQDYEIADYDGFSINEVNTMVTNNQLDMMLEKKGKKQSQSQSQSQNEDEEGEGQNASQVPKTKIYIRYFLTKTLRPANLQEMIDDLFNVEEILTKADTLFIVVKDDINDTLTNSLRHIWESEGIFIVLQTLTRLQFNILDHVLVPNHRVISEDEKILVKKRFNIMTDGQFPELPRFDPVAQVIGIRPGQVCEIIRPSKTAISSMYYRICV